MDIEEMQKRRKQLKMTYKDLSAKSGIPERTVYDVLLGNTKTPRIDTVQAIEKALGLDNDGITVVSKGLSEKEERLLEAFSCLIPTMQDYIVEMVEKLTEQEQNIIKRV